MASISRIAAIVCKSETLSFISTCICGKSCGTLGVGTVRTLFEVISEILIINIAIKANNTVHRQSTHLAIKRLYGPFTKPKKRVLKRSRQPPFLIGEKCVCAI